MKVAFIPIVGSALGTVTKGLVQGLEDLGITRRLETRISPNTAKSTGDLNRLDVTQTPQKGPSGNFDVKNSQGA